MSCHVTQTVLICDAPKVFTRERNTDASVSVTVTVKITVNQTNVYVTTYIYI